MMKLLRRAAILIKITNRRSILNRHNLPAKTDFTLTAKGALYTVYKNFIMAIKYCYIHIVLLKTMFLHLTTTKNYVQNFL
jgi:hypothetical protein